MDSCHGQPVNVKQNFLKNHTEHVGDLDNKERFSYIYFYFGNNYNLVNLIIENSFAAFYLYIPYSLVHTPNVP